MLTFAVLHLKFYILRFIKIFILTFQNLNDYGKQLKKVRFRRKTY